MVIRPFQSEDQVPARDLILRGLGEHFGFIDETMNPDLLDIQSSYVDQGHDFLVAIQSNQMIGTGALMHITDEVGQLARISVDTGLRRSGIGSTIVLSLLDLALTRGYQEVHLETNKTWSEVIRFYETLGFAVYREHEGQAHMSLSLTSMVGR